ncbi:MAG: 50S ribosomal protein L30 [Candidatus Micrarchaeia archaeon]
MPECLAVIRVRGRTGIRPEVEATLRLLRLTRVNHLSLLPRSPSVEGMLRACKDYITWGEIDAALVAKLLERRGRLSGNKRLTLAHLKAMNIASFDQLAAKLVACELRPEDIGLKPVFRLHPPRKGWGEIKRTFPEGALGYRGRHIGELVTRMM